MIEPQIQRKGMGLVAFLATLPAHDMANFNTMVRITPLNKLRLLHAKAPNHAKLMAYYMVVAKAIQILRDKNETNG